jgi:MFS family permease
VSQLGIISGPLLGGAFTEYLTWRWCKQLETLLQPLSLIQVLEGFYINLPAGALVAIFLLFIKIPDQVVKPSIRVAHHTILHQLDLIGFVLFSPAALQLLLALEYGQNNNSWGSATVIGLFCGAAATFIAFLLWEHSQGDEAMIPLKMIAITRVWSRFIVMMAIFGILLCSSYYLPIYFQAVKNDSPTISGVSTLPGILSQLLFAVASGVLSKSAWCCEHMTDY